MELPYERPRCGDVLVVGNTDVGAHNDDGSVFVAVSWIFERELSRVVVVVYLVLRGLVLFGSLRVPVHLKKKLILGFEASLE